LSLKSFYENKYSTKEENINPMKITALGYFPPPPLKLLDVGCGTGVLSRLLVERGYDVTGIDLSENAITRCKRKGLDAFQQDLSERLLFGDEEFDGILMSEVIEHIADTFFVLHELYRVLKKGGVFILTTPNSVFITRRLRYLIGKTPTETQNFSHLRFFNKTLLTRIMEEANYDVINFKGYLFNPLNLSEGFVLDHLVNLLSENFIVVMKKPQVA
jgi:methionine biosynthesis protein MetW